MAVPLLVPLITSLVSAGATMLGNRQRNKAEERLAQEQREYNETMWERQNQYNHPLQQMKRFENAGLNPNLIYGQTSGGAAGNAGDVRGYDRAQLKSVTDGMKGFENFYDFRSIESRINNTDTNTLAQSINNAREGIKLDIDRNTKQDLIGKVKSEAKTALENSRMAGSQAEITEQQARVATATVEDRIREIGSNASRAQIEKQLSSLRYELDRKLKPLGLTSSDPAYMRIIANLIDRFTKNNSNASLIQSIWNNFKF